MCAQNGASNEAIVLFNGMREAGPNPDKVTMIEVLSAYSTIGALDLGKWVETHASERGLQHDVYVASELIDMYAKCGSLDDALRVFESMPHKNKVSWNAMISALAFHGQVLEALSLFRRMSKDNGTVQSNDITFIGVLSACVHVGLVDEGRQLFESMKLSFGLVPKVEHYSCMVDLCAHAGLLNEAWDLIKKMPGKPDEIVLGSLLGACQRRKNADAGERCGVSKTPGCSWIEVGARAHEFHAGDSLNHHSVNVYQLLNEEIKREGCIKYWLHIEVEKLNTWLPLSAIEQCIRRDYIFWLMTPAKMLNAGNMIKLKDIVGREEVRS
ncbi:hypothetical protein POTOM_057725 [Populus tomentosa]|uniref:Pentatricopeptide repeat-containing protein n=1 Tax=Populus tomentosa TaxID=118781 RepID=A0A8X7Y1C4_POPTO|nr:hypothetical protein POTOM_057725 [Populus tomentosa]